jgi:hypothetical protein
VEDLVCQVLEGDLNFQLVGDGDAIIGSEGVREIYSSIYGDEKIRIEKVVGAPVVEFLNEGVSDQVLQDGEYLISSTRVRWRDGR